MKEKFRRKILLLICSVITISSVSFAQTTQPGIVLEYKGAEKKVPLKRSVQLYADSASSTFSDANTGRFSLSFPKKKPGDALRFSQLPKIKGYTLFNTDVISSWNISPSSDMNIIFCSNAQFEQLKAKYYNVFLTPHKEEYDVEKHKLKTEIDELNKTVRQLKREASDEKKIYQEKIRSLRKKLDDLETNFKKIQSNAEYYVDWFARIDLSEISKEEAEAIHLVDEGRINEAIEKYKSMNTINLIKELADKRSSLECGVQSLQNDINKVKPTLLREVSLLLESIFDEGRDRAIMLLNSYSEIAPFDSEIHNILMYLLEGRNEHKAMIDVCQKSIAKLPSNDIVSLWQLKHWQSIAMFHRANQLKSFRDYAPQDSLVTMQMQINNILKDAWELNHEALELATPLYYQMHLVNDKQMMELFIWNGVISLYNNDTKNALEVFNKAKAIVDKIQNNSLAKAILETKIGDCYILMGDEQKALPHHLLGWKYSEEYDWNSMQYWQETTLCGIEGETLFNNDSYESHGTCFALLNALNHAIYQAGSMLQGSLISWNVDELESALKAFDYFDIDNIDWCILYELKYRILCNLLGDYESYNVFREFKQINSNYLDSIKEVRAADNELVYFLEHINNKSAGDKFSVIEFNGKMGIIDSIDNVVVTNEYDFIRITENDDAAIIYKDGKCGMIDMEGHTIVPLCYDSYRRSASFYLFSRKNETIILDDRYRTIGHSKHNLIEIIFLLGDENKYESIAFTTRKKKSKKVGLLNMKGKTYLPFEYESINPLYGNRKILVLKKEGDVGLWDCVEKRFILPCSLYEDINCYNEFYDMEHSGLTWGFINGYMSVKKDGKWGVVNAQLEEIIPCIYDFITESTSGFALKKDGVEKYWSIEEWEEVNDYNK